MNSIYDVIEVFSIHISDMVPCYILYVFFSIAVLL